MGHPISFDQIAETLRGMPELAGRIPKNNGEKITLPRMEVEPFVDALSFTYRTREQTFFDQARKLLQLEAESGA